MTSRSANPDDFNDPEDVDEETTGHLHREIEKAEADEAKHPQGRPNSFLNRLISHGNEKTEKELQAMQAEKDARMAKENQNPSAISGSATSAASDNVIR